MSLVSSTAPRLGVLLPAIAAGARPYFAPIHQVRLPSLPFYAAPQAAPRSTGTVRWYTQERQKWEIKSPFTVPVDKPQFLMPPIRPLTLPEELMLLAIDRKGKYTFSEERNVVLSAALLIHLYLKGKIALTRESYGWSKKLIVKPISESGSGSKVADKFLAKLKNTLFKLEYPFQDWVESFAESSLESKTIDELREKGVLSERRITTFGPFWKTRYEPSSAPKQELIDKLRNAIIAGEEKVDYHTAVLVTLCEKLNLLVHYFSPEELLKYNERISQIKDGKLVETVDLALSNLEWDDCMQTLIMINNINMMNIMIHSHSHNH